MLPRPGEVIDGRYRLGDVFASGGMGMIMKAEQLSTGRDVAVKLLHPHIAARPDFAARFMREAQVATLFDHPHIVRVYDVGETKSAALYLVMELLEGEELKELIEREAPLSTGRVLNLGLQMLDGLAEAHSREVVHRDLKPANIFACKSRRGEHLVKLLDFGIAKLVDGEQSQVTQAGSITGTPSYLAPESMFNAPDVNKKAADVYAAGLVLLEMLTARRSFAAEGSAQTLLMHLKRPVIIPEVIANTALGEVIKRATFKHPDDRYPDAEAMYAALLAARESTPKDIKLSAEQIPESAADTSPAFLRFMADQSPDADTNLEVLRQMPQHETFDPSRPVERVVPLMDEERDKPTEIDIPSSDLLRTGRIAALARPEAERATGGRLAAILAVSALIIVVLMVVGAAWLNGDEPAAEMAQEMAAEVPDAPATVNVLAGVAAVEALVEEVAPAEAPKEPTIHFRIASKPAGASVFAGDVMLGKTALALDLKAHELPTTVRLALAGYVEQSVRLDEANEAIEVVLVRVASREAPSKTAPKSPTDDTEKPATPKDSSIDRLVDQFLPDL